MIVKTNTNERLKYQIGTKPTSANEKAGQIGRKSLKSRGLVFFPHHQRAYCSTSSRCYTDFARATITRDIFIPGTLYGARTKSQLNSFPLTLRVKAACFVLAIEVLLHARVLTLICACRIFKANFSHYKFSNANLRHF